MKNRNSPRLLQRKPFCRREVAQAIEKGFREIFPDANMSQAAVMAAKERNEAMIAATQGVERAAWVTGPLRKVKACWGMSGDGKPRLLKWRRPVDWRWFRQKNATLITTSRERG